MYCFIIGKPGVKHVVLILGFIIYVCGENCLPVIPKKINKETQPGSVPYSNKLECIKCNSESKGSKEIVKSTIKKFYCDQARCKNFNCACCVNNQSCPFIHHPSFRREWHKHDCPNPKSGPNTDTDYEEPLPNRDETSKNHIPLIIGFAVGGIMLAVVIAGVLLGRANRALSPSDSSVATTPVSMSYSEWISNYSTGGWGSKHVNTRVQESAGSLSDVEDSPGMSVYKIMYGEADATTSEKYKLNDNDATVIEIDEMGNFENPNQLTFYHPHNDILSCIATPLHDEKHTTAVESWSNNEAYPYESVIRVPKSDPNCNDTEPYFSTSWRSWRNHYDRESICWSATASIRRNSVANESIYSKRRDTWSDESNADKRSSIYRFSFPAARSYVSGDASSTHSGWIRVPKHLNINFANLKHVFVDVHRSMSYSYDDERSSGFWAPSSSSGTLTAYDDSDFEKTKSFITIKNNYICYENEIPPELHDELFLYSLQYNAHMRPRRCSI